MRHHRRAEDADRDVEHLVIVQQRRVRQEAVQQRREMRMRPENLQRKTDADHQDEAGHERFDITEPAVLQEEHHEDIARREADAPDERQPEKKLQRDGRADHLGEVARADGDLAKHPQRDRDRPGVVIAAGLRQVTAGGDTEAGRERLEQHRHEAGKQHDAEQCVAKARAAGEISRPVARVHVADGNHQPRPGESEQLAEKAAAARDGHAPVHLAQARLRGLRPPGAPSRRGRIDDFAHGRDFRQS